jgi:hypothetical protein
LTGALLRSTSYRRPDAGRSCGSAASSSDAELLAAKALLLSGPIGAPAGGLHAFARMYPVKGPTLTSDRFEIVVRGELPPDLVATIAGFAIHFDTDGHTHLVGAVPDQTAFNQLLQSLLQGDIELVSVNPVREE